MIDALSVQTTDPYDIETVEVMRRCLKPDSVCVDVGAHTGKILRYMCRLAPDGGHYAFEPVPALARRLRRRFRDVHVFELALGDRSGESSFSLVRNALAYSGLVRRSYDRPDPIVEEIEVRVGRLDDIVPQNVEVAFIKLDIEGGEYHALRGAARTIRRCGPTVVFEASSRSTGHYGVSSRMLYEQLASCGLNVSTMRRWLDGLPAFGESEFLRVYDGEYYFIAYPGYSVS